jgi:hypothetical protein
VALGKKLFCRVPEKKHLAKYLTLDKEPNFGKNLETKDQVPANTMELL